MPPSISVLKLPNFRLLVLTRMLCHIGLQALGVIVGWQIYTLTQSYFLLGLIGLAEAVPAIIASFFSGYAVDISTPHKVYKFCLIALIANMAFLMMVGGNYLSLDNHTQVALLFFGTFISGLARSFMMPSYFSMTPQIVERKDYSSASAWGNAGFQIAVISGPILAGLIYGFCGVRSAWIIPVTAMTLAMLSLININGLRPLERFDTSHNSPLQNIIDGWKFIITHRMLLTVMAVDMFAVLFGGAVAMLPAFADQILKVGPEGLGLLRTAPAFGAILAAIYFAIKPMRTFPLPRMLLTVAAFAICMIGFGLSTSFYLSMFFLALSGLFDTIGVVIRTTIKQILTPDHMRGRVAAISGMFVISSNELGAFESGVAARIMGLVPSVVFGGIMSLTVAGVAYLVTPKLRKTIIDDRSPTGAK